MGLPFLIKFYLKDWRATARPRQSHVIRVFITAFVAVCEARQSQGVALSMSEERLIKPLALREAAENGNAQV